MHPSQWSQRYVSRRTALTASVQILAAVGLSACGASTTVSTSTQSSAQPTTAAAVPAATPSAASTASASATTSAAPSSSAASSAANVSTTVASNSATATATSTSTSSSAGAASSAAPTPTVNPNAVNVQSYGFTIGYVDALAQFSKQNTSVQTQLTTGPFPAKFLTLAAAGKPPDVLFVPSGGSVLSYASQQLLLPLDQNVQTAKISSADFYTPAWNENLFGGKVYAITNEVDPNFAFALMPAGPNVKPDPSWLGGWELGIPNGSKKLDQAWQVLAWMNASPDGTDLWASLNNFLAGYKKSTFCSKNAGNPLVTGYQAVLAGAHLVPPALGSAQATRRAPYSTRLSRANRT